MAITTMKIATIEEKRSILRGIFAKSKNLSPNEFTAFFRLYDELSTVHRGDVVVPMTPTVSVPPTHGHLVEAIDVLKRDPELTKQEAHRAFMHRTTTGINMASIDAERILNLAVHCTIMVDCSAKSSHAPGYKLGDYTPMSWQPTERYVDFVENAFGSRSSLECGGIKMTSDFKMSLTAWNLQKRLGIRFQSTDDLMKHLLFDSHERTLFIFHHVKFLKTQAEIHSPIQDKLGLTIENSLRQGTLPPQLLAETLHSIKVVLFPSHDKKSRRLLKKLISSRDTQFDPECSCNYDNPLPVRYVYWAKRIAELHELLKSRPPKNKMERWFQWQSSEGNALLVAFIALLISIIVGVISIGLSAVQIWISWMAWKHPVES